MPPQIRKRSWLLANAQVYMELMERWAAAAGRSGLVHQQVAVAASEFAGIVIANAGLSLEGQAEMLALCNRAASTKCAANNINKRTAR